MRWTALGATRAIHVRYVDSSTVVSIGLTLWSLMDGERLSAHREKKPKSDGRMVGRGS
jgi:hypothetical protein